MRVSYPISSARPSSKSESGILLGSVLIAFFGLFRVILSRAEIEFTEEEEDSDSEVSEGTEAARVGLYGLDA
jgi:hypothetical protein